MKFALGLLLAAVAVTDTFGESLTPNGPPITGLGPTDTSSQNLTVQQAIQDLADQSSGNGNENINVINPQTLPVQNPADIAGLGPTTPLQQNQQNQQNQQQPQGTPTTNTLVINPNQKPFTPSTLEGLGPQTPAGSNQNIQNGIKQLAGPPASTPTNNDNFHNIDPRTLPVVDPKCQNRQGPVTQSGQFTQEEMEKLLRESADGCDGQPRNCDRMCPEVYEPVCGSDYKVYSNSCFLSLAACQDPGITQVEDDACSDQPRNCDRMCPDVYEPVCGSDYKVYSNSCFLDLAACQDPGITQVEDDACSDQPRNCDRMCPDVYEPVCGSDHIRYSNSCFLNLAACQDPGITQVEDDACSDPATGIMQN